MSTVGKNPEGSYLMELDEPDPCNMPQVRNDVQHASRWNRAHRAIEILCGRIGNVTAQIVLPYDLRAPIPVELIAAPMYMTFAGVLQMAALRIVPEGSSFVVDILKNGVSVCGGNCLTIVAGAQAVIDPLTGWTLPFVAGDRFQASVISNTSTTAFCVSLRASRTT